MAPRVRRSEREPVDRLLRSRLDQFLTAMLPTAVGFAVLYLAGALIWRSVALAGGCAVVCAYAVALVAARARAREGNDTAAALITGYALLGMVAVGCFFVHFLFAALLLMTIAAVAVVLPYVTGLKLRVFLAVTLATNVEIVVVSGVLPPAFEQPPRLLQHVVLVAAVIACALLTLRLLWVDAQRLREAVRLRDEFLAVASHELKTPLTPLTLRLDLLARATSDGELSAAASRRLPEDVRSMQHQVRRLADLVNALLDVTRIREHKLDLRPEEGVDLGQIAREVVSRFQLEASRLGCSLVVDAVPVAGTWDPMRLDQVITNLVSNALKYGDGKPVVVRVDRSADDAARVTVRDQGIGMTAAQIDFVFERFARAVSDRNYGGLGLGLYISREIVHAMGGTLRAESQPGVGTTITLLLPKA